MIVTHEGRGWFDPVNGGKGDVLALAQLVWGGTLGHARKSLRPLAGRASAAPTRQAAGEAEPRHVAATWDRAALPRPGSQAWRYLTRERGLAADTIERGLANGVLREGIYGTIWAAHQTAAGDVTGWEMRGPNYKGFSKGGRKRLFRVGPIVPDRVAVTESAIDALSLAVIEGWRGGTLYVSTGGGWGVEAGELLAVMLGGTARLVIATDRGSGGELMASRLESLAREWGVVTERLCPDAHDWNDQLRGGAAPS